jgi:hypothetical protein
MRPSGSRISNTSLDVIALKLRAADATRACAAALRRAGWEA